MRPAACERFDLGAFVATKVAATVRTAPSVDSGHRLWSFVPRLIDAELAAARQAHLRKLSPGLLLNRRTGNAAGFHFGDERAHVVTHQIEFVDIVLVVWMHGDLGRR